jgi:hypothetical protein
VPGQCQNRYKSFRRERTLPSQLPPDRRQRGSWAPNRTNLASQATMRVDLTSLKVAIVHYWFIELRRGGEKVIDSLCKLFPQADIFTHVLDEKVFPDLVANHRVRTSFINGFPMPEKQK